MATATLTQDYDRISPFNRAWQNLLVSPENLGMHKHESTTVAGTFTIVVRDSVKQRADVAYRKGTVVSTPRPRLPGAPDLDRLGPRLLRSHHRGPAGQGKNPITGTNSNFMVKPNERLGNYEVMAPPTAGARARLRRGRRHLSRQAHPPRHRGRHQGAHPPQEPPAKGPRRVSIRSPLRRIAHTSADRRASSISGKARSSIPTTSWNFARVAASRISGNNGPPDENTCIQWLFESAAALAYAHSERHPPPRYQAVQPARRPAERNRVGQAHRFRPRRTMRPGRDSARPCDRHPALRRSRAVARPAPNPHRMSSRSEPPSSG